MTVVLDDDALAEHLARIDEDGSTIVEDAIEPELVVALRDTIRRLQGELGLAPLGTAAEGHSTLRTYNLLAKDPVFQAMPVHPSVLPVVERLLDRGCLLSGMTAIDIGPGEDPQPMHGDDIVMSRHLVRPHAPMMVTSMWALTDFTGANGGTRYIPGFVRQQQNHYLAVPPEIVASFSDRLLELLGYRLYKGIMGHVDGRSPGEVVFGDRFAETAYRDAEQRRAGPARDDG